MSLKEGEEEETDNGIDEEVRTCVPVLIPCRVDVDVIVSIYSGTSLE